MPGVHHLVTQLRFARSELLRAIDGLSDEDARRRLLPMNCISWNIGHLAWQEQRYWLWRGQGRILRPDIRDAFAYGAAASTPALADVLEAWRELTVAADPWLDEATSAFLAETHEGTDTAGQPTRFTFGSLLLRTIDHYWYHTGESMAVRQLLGHAGLPEFVGNIDDEAPYRPE